MIQLLALVLNIDGRVILADCLHGSYVDVGDGLLERTKAWTRFTRAKENCPRAVRM